MGKSDPYVVLSVGAQSFKSKIINNTVNPKWDYHCEVRCMSYIIVLLNDFIPFKFLRIIHLKHY